MTIQEAIKSGKPFRLPNYGPGEAIEYFIAGTGPFAEVAPSSDYFSIFGTFSTSLDLYASEILSEEWENY